MMHGQQNVKNVKRMCVCRLRYQSCNAHAPYCHLWPAGLYILSHYLTKTARFSQKKITGHKMHVFILSTPFVWKISHYKKIWDRCDKKCELVFM